MQPHPGFHQLSWGKKFPYRGKTQRERKTSIIVWHGFFLKRISAVQIFQQSFRKHQIKPPLPRKYWLVLRQNKKLFYFLLWQRPKLLCKEHNCVITKCRKLLKRGALVTWKKANNWMHDVLVAKRNTWKWRNQLL